LNSTLPVEIQVVQQRLHSPPGRSIQAEFAPELSYGRQFGPPPHHARPSSVLIALFRRDGQWLTTLTRRNPRLKVHAGQVCFPGGAQDPGENATECAYREWVEELGPQTPGWQTIGELSPIYVFVSNHFVRPFVAFCEPPSYEPNADEVEQVIEFPIEILFDPACRGKHETHRWGTRFDSPHYHFNGELIWGATAVMLAELGAVAESIMAKR